MTFLGSKLRLFIKKRETASKPVTTLEIERPLSVHERKLLHFLLTHASAEAELFLPQLDQTIVVGKCSCGCPTVDLKGPDQVDEVISHSGPLVDFLGRTADGRQVGILVWASRRQLSGLEIYNMSESDEPWGLPTIASLIEFSGESLRKLNDA